MDNELCKPATTMEQQIDTLKSRGLHINDEEFAVKVLLRVHYYRLRGYYNHWFIDDKFKPNITFDHIYRLYCFDEKLKGMLYPLLSEIEITFKSKFAFNFSLMVGPLEYRSFENFIHIERFNQFNTIVKKNTEESKEKFARHHIENKGGVFPFWAIVELLSFGATSKMFANLKYSIRVDLAKKFGIKENVLCNHMRCISNLRNICYHQNRIYNRNMADGAKLPDFVQKPIYENMEKTATSDVAKTLFGYLLIMKNYLEESTWQEFLFNLECLIGNFVDVVELARLGLPINWKEILSEPVHLFFDQGV